MTMIESILARLSILSDADLETIIAACQVEVQERADWGVRVDYEDDYDESVKEDFDEALRRQYSEDELEAIRRQYREAEHHHRDNADMDF